MKELIGQPFWEEAKELVMPEDDPKDMGDLWTYACTIGDEWEVITREDGTLTVKKKDAV